jgi:DMSO/TMAO reductase YedYZ heme-binding membrane subunit
VATTRSRPRGRESARPSADGIIAAEHATKVYGIAIGGIVVIIAFLALTSIGHVIDAATQHFMLYYAGVFALIALCASVGLGLVATDRMILNPGHRIFVQSAHRAASFGALAFLVIHIVTEILAQRVHALDAFVPFLSPFRTFYIGLGTISSDLIVLLVITSIVRKRFTAHGKAWRWRAIHYTSYVAFVFGVWHGLLGGRPGKPYVDWSYGFVVAFVAIGLAVRILANSLRPKENLSAPPVPESADSASAPIRAASMFAQLGVVRAMTSAVSASAPAAATGMLSTPVGGWSAEPATGPARAHAALPGGPAAQGNTDRRQPRYEPGYVGPPRYMGTPRSAGTGPMPRVDSGPMPRVATGPQSRAVTGPQPRLGQPAQTGNIPQAGGVPAPGRGSGPMPRVNTGPQPRVNTGPMPRANTGPMPRANTGPMPRAATGPMPAAGTGRMPPGGTAPRPRANTGPQPWQGISVPPDGWGVRGARAAARPPGDRRGARGQARPGAVSWDGQAVGQVDTTVTWNYGLPPWDGSAPEPDPSFRYREPGPGMPGYRGPRDRYRGSDPYRGGDDLR